MLNPLTSRFYLFIVVLLFCQSCKNEPKASSNDIVIDPSFESKIVEKKIGDCTTDDRCLKVLVSYPSLVGVDPVIQGKVNAGILAEIIESMDIEPENDNTESMAIEAAAEEWAKLYKEYLSEDLGDREMTLTYQVEGKGSLYKNYAITELPVSTFTGGAHPNHYTYLTNYNLATGAEIELDSIVSDGIAFRKILEKEFYKAVKEKGGEADKELYFWGKPFYLPANFSITNKGLYFLYNPYEIAPYAFGITAFTIPYKKLEGTIKLP